MKTNDSNFSLRWNRSSQEALGYRLQSWHFPPEDPKVGDMAVAICCLAVSVLICVIPYLFDIKIGG